MNSFSGWILCNLGILWSICLSAILLASTKWNWTNSTSHTWLWGICSFFHSQLILLHQGNTRSPKAVHNPVLNQYFLVFETDYDGDSDVAAFVLYSNLTAVYQNGLALSTVQPDYNPVPLVCYVMLLLFTIHSMSLIYNIIWWFGKVIQVRIELKIQQWSSSQRHPLDSFIWDLLLQQLSNHTQLFLWTTSMMPQVTRIHRLFSIPIWATFSCFSSQHIQRLGTKLHYWVTISIEKLRISQLLKLQFRLICTSMIL